MACRRVLCIWVKTGVVLTTMILVGTWGFRPQSFCVLCVVSFESLLWSLTMRVPHAAHGSFDGLVWLI